MIGRRALRFLAGAVAMTGAVFLASGLWIPAKAALAQWLLQRAWSASRADNAPVKAWPWADAAPVARLHLNGEAMVVLSGGSGEALAFAPTLVPGSAPPGAPGLGILAGHRDTHFALLARLPPGSRIELEDLSGRRTAYRVKNAHVLAISRLSVPADSRRRLALVTCWPFNAIDPSGSERFVLFADAVP